MANIKLADRDGNLTIEVPKEIANSTPETYVYWAWDHNPYDWGYERDLHSDWLTVAFGKISKRKFGWRWWAKNPLTYWTIFWLIVAAFAFVNLNLAY